MKRLIIVGTILLLSAMYFGAIFGIEYPLLVLASNTVEYAAIRLALIILLLGLLLSAPPRSLYFRIVLAAVSVSLFVSSLTMMLDYSMEFIDALIFMEVAVIFALEAAEGSLRVALPAPKIKAPSTLTK